MLYYHDTENERGHVELEIEFNYRPGTAAYMSQRHGWNPGWEDEAEIIAVRVLRIETDAGVIERADMPPAMAEALDLLVWTKDLENKVYDKLLETGAYWNHEDN